MGAVMSAVVDAGVVARSLRPGADRVGATLGYSRPAALRAVFDELPPRAGLALATQHMATVLERRPAVGFFEVHAQPYLSARNPIHAGLERIRQRYPLSVRTTGLTAGSRGPLDAARLEQLAALVERYEPQAVCERLTWPGHDSVFLADLAPLPCDLRSLARVCEHVDRVQERLARRVFVENPSVCVDCASPGLTEAQLLHELTRRTGCGLVLDLTSAYVTCVNLHRDPFEFVDSLPLSEVCEVRVAGFDVDLDANGERLLIDTRSRPVHSDVWALYDYTLSRVGPVATLIEREHAIPSLGVLMREARLAERLLAAAGADTLLR